MPEDLYVIYGSHWKIITSTCHNKLGSASERYFCVCEFFNIIFIRQIGNSSQWIIHEAPFECQIKLDYISFSRNFFFNCWLIWITVVRDKRANEYPMKIAACR